MVFHSILFRSIEDHLDSNKIEEKAPAFFVDVNLDQIIDDITGKKEVYNLKPFFYTKLDNIPAIKYRQEVMAELENPLLHAHIESFADQMRKMNTLLSGAKESSFKYEKARLFLDAVSSYVKAITELTDNLSNVQLKSVGFLEFQIFLTDYTNSSDIGLLSQETKSLIAELDALTYCIRIKDLRIEVSPTISRSDYSKEVEKTFDIFKQEPVKDYRIEFNSGQSISHVQASILEGVAQLYPKAFQNLEDYAKDHKSFLNKTIEIFDREIQFYMAYLDYIAVLKTAGLSFCYPEITKSKNELYTYEGFDLALANKLTKQKSTIVCNDFQLSGQERMLVITGPNQGGKTTYARTIGQLQYLANIGCAVPGKKAKLFLFDQIFTHFEKDERTEDHQSKLESDLLKTHQILSASSENSILIMNEILSSTTLQDAIYLSKKVMYKIFQLDAICVWVTFIDELASLNEHTVSMVSTVDPENPAVRTFKIVRQETTGLAYALSLAEKHNVTYKDIKERIKG